jgi:O-antigen ligase
LDRLELISLYVVAYFLPISKALMEIFIYLGIAAFITKKLILKQDAEKFFLNKFVAAYLLICFISIFSSSNLRISASSFLGKVLQNVAFFFVIVDTLHTRKRIKIFLLVLLCSSFVLGVDGIYQYFTHKDFIRRRPDFMIPRIYATFPSPSDFGCYLVALIPFTVSLFFAPLRRKTVRFASIGLFALLSVCLLLTVSRGAWFAFIASMLFMGVWLRLITVFFLLLGIAIIFLQPYFNPYIRERLNNFFIFADNSSTDRRFMWDAGGKMFLSRPWIGVGIGTFMFNFRKFVDPSFAYIAYAHNCYLQMAAEIGILGLGVFLILLGSFFWKGIDMLNHQVNKTFEWYILLASLASLLGYCVQMSVDTMFYSLDLGVLFWLILGYGSATMRLISGETVPSPHPA